MSKTREELEAEAGHFVSGSCVGEFCSACYQTARVKVPAKHKLGEEIPFDDPNPRRHNLTAYVCCAHFRGVVGPAAPCQPEGPDTDMGI
jgi:hypothetical protein